MRKGGGHRCSPGKDPSREHLCGLEHDRVRFGVPRRRRRAWVLQRTSCGNRGTLALGGGFSGGSHAGCSRRSSLHRRGTPPRGDQAAPVQATRRRRRGRLEDDLEGRRGLAPVPAAPPRSKLDRVTLAAHDEGGKHGGRAMGHPRRSRGRPVRGSWVVPAPDAKSALETIINAETAFDAGRPRWVVVPRDVWRLMRKGGGGLAISAPRKRAGPGEQRSDKEPDRVRAKRQPTTSSISEGLGCGRGPPSARIKKLSIVSHYGHAPLTGPWRNACGRAAAD